jgi:hypothetical protein
MSGAPTDAPNTSGNSILQKLFIAVIVIAYVLQVVQGFDTVRGTSTSFSIDYIVISVLPIAFYLISYLLQSAQLTRLARVYRATAAAAAAWCLWNALGLVAERFLTSGSALRILEVSIYLAVAVFIALTCMLLYLRTRKIW